MKETKGLQIGKKIKLSLFGITWFYNIKKEKTLKTPQKKLLELVNEMRKVAGYTISIQESVEFLLTNNEISKMEI